MIKNIVFSFVVLAFFCVSSVVHAQAIIRDIQVEGAERIEPSTILSYLNVSPGDPMTRETLNEGLKSLYATGLFADITLRQQGDSTLLVSVVENPVVNEIAFEGNDRLKDEQLLAEIQVRPRQVFTRSKIQNDVTRLYQVYRRNGRFSAQIEPKIIELDQNRINLVFEIDEGDVTKVEAVRFVGNKRFSDDKLRSVISTKESAWYRFINNDDRYDPDRLSYDQELLRRFYLSQGYADFQLVSAVAELSNDRKDFYVTMTIEEGERYKFGDIKIDSRLQNTDSSALETHISVEKGDWYDAERVQEDVNTLTDALGDMQFAFVSVRPQTDRLREERVVNLVYQINETPRVFVERIDVNGNVRTQDRVIRREMKLVEGDPFNKSKLARSEQKIRNLNYFEKVDVNLKPGSAPDKSVIEVEVAEKSTGELSVGAGFSTNDGPLADFSIRERNFLGKGQDLLFSTTIAGERTEFNTSFTEPYFLDRDLSAGVDVFHITRDLQDESSYDQKRSGGGLRLGYPLSERWRQRVGYRIERNEVENVAVTASRYIRDQEGQRDTSAINQRTTYDSRDSTIFPTNGLYYWFDTELAGLGGDAKYISGKTGASYYYPIADKWVFNILGEGGAATGYSNEDVEINERFFLGGSTLRGFEQAGVGPRDILTSDSLGGNVFYRGSVELSFPVGLPESLGVQGHAFGDAGSLFDVDDSGTDVVDEKTIRTSAGVGLSWRSPFGPIRFDYAEPITDEEYDEIEKFRINFGTRF